MQLEFLIVTSVMVVSLSYFLYVPPHETAVNKQHWILHRGIMQLCKYVGMACTYTGILSFGDEALVIKKVFGVLEHFNSLANSSEVQITEHSFSGVPTLVFSPVRKPEPGPAVIYMHGGGWFFQHPSSYDVLLSEFVIQLGFTVFAINYRKAPEHIFPAAFDDCLAATIDIMNQADKFQFNPSRVALSGDSSGGQLAASVTMHMINKKDTMKHLPKLQLLIYPVTQVANMQTESFRRKTVYPSPNVYGAVVSFYLTGSGANAKQFLLNQHSSEKVAATWLKIFNAPLPREGAVKGKLASELEPKILDIRMSPLLAPSFENLPPLYLITAKHDVLEWEGVAYADRLRKAGARVFHKSYDTFHGSIVSPGDNNAMIKDVIKFFNENAML